MWGKVRIEQAKHCMSILNPVKTLSKMMLPTAKRRTDSELNAFGTFKKRTQVKQLCIKALPGFPGFKLIIV